ncbi:MAG: amidohydrolase [Lachnospiraceae bacterium]|nr:amidohydrolase [Lachnospiraceae bacterium]
MKIIDTHVHIGGENVGFHMTEQMVMEMMKDYDIAYAIVSNGDAGEFDHQQQILAIQHTQEEALQRTLDFARAYPEKIGVAVWIKPHLQGLTKELEKMIEENLDIVKAIKLHPFHSNILPTDKRVLPYLELAEHYHLPVVSHTGGCEAAEPVHLYEAAKMFSTIPFVMVHMGLGSDNREALDLLGKADNLYGDTTWVPISTTLEAVKRYGAEKMLFGSDAPIDGKDTYLCNPKGERSLYQDYFHVLPELISEADYHKIMHENAECLFSI